MANPDPYVRGYGFANYQSSNPTSPLPGNRVDVELDDISDSLGQTQTALQDIRRSDGALNNGIVTPESFSTASLALMQDWNFRGAWVALTAYAANDVVSRAGATYVVPVAYTSSASLDTDLSNGDLLLFANPPGALGQILFASFDGDGTTVSFNVGVTLVDPKQVQVFVDSGVVSPEVYSVSGSNIVLDSAPPVGVDNVLVFGADLAGTTSSAEAVASAAAASVSAAAALASETAAETAESNAGTAEINAQGYATDAAASASAAAASAASIDISLSGANTFTGSNAFNGAFALNGLQSETLVSTTNDLALGATANSLEIDLTGDQTLNGLTGGAEGREIRLRNIDASETLIISHDASGSTAANRFALPAGKSFSVLPGTSVVLRYSSSRWRLIAQTFSTGTDAGDLVQLDANGIIDPSLSLPSGMTFYWPSDNPPSWALERDGSAISRAIYAKLFAVIGTTYGAGDGSTTFNLPDDRGEFIRGWDNGRGVDSGRVFGSTQADEFKSHSHNMSAANGVAYNGGSNTGPMSGFAGTFTSDLTGGAETRPRNRAYLPCIVY